MNEAALSPSSQAYQRGADELLIGGPTVAHIGKSYVSRVAPRDSAKMTPQVHTYRIFPAVFFCKQNPALIV